jgi:hypothetical protein
MKRDPESCGVKGRGLCIKEYQVQRSPSLGVFLGKGFSYGAFLDLRSAI